MCAVAACSSASAASRLCILVFLCLLCATSQARILGGLSLHHQVRVTISSLSRSSTRRAEAPPVSDSSSTPLESTPQHAHGPPIPGPCPIASSFPTRYVHSAAAGYLSTVNRQPGPNIPGPAPVSTPPTQPNNPTIAPGGGSAPQSPVNQVPTSPAPSPFPSPGTGFGPAIGKTVALGECRFGLRRMLGFLLFELIIECAYVVVKFLVSSERIGLELRHLVIIRAAYVLFVFPIGVGILFFGPGENHDCKLKCEHPFHMLLLAG